MIKNNKKLAILSSVVTLLPILFGLMFWNQLPQSMVSHWGGGKYERNRNCGQAGNLDKSGCGV